MENKSLPVMDAETRAAYFAAHLNQRIEFRNEIYTLRGVLSGHLSIRSSDENIAIPGSTLILSGDFSGIGHEQTCTINMNDCRLLLTEPHLITDDDIIALARIEGVGVHGIEITDVKPFVRGLSFYSNARGVRYEYQGNIVELIINQFRIKKQIIHRAQFSSICANADIFHYSEMLDFLKMRGYATFFRGLSIDELVAFGVLRLKEGESK